MAENKGEGKQSQGIGELFIEFGSKGLPTLLKGLNTVSASFLLGKNAASQFANMLTKPIKDAGNAAVQIGKMSSALGITMKEAMKLQMYFQKHGLSESLLGDLTSVSDMLTKVQMGIGGISSEFAYAMHKMGLDWTDYDGSMESMIRLTNDVKKATAGMEANQKRVLMKAVGLSPEWSYAFERGDFNLADYKTITDEQVQALIDSQEAMNNLTGALKQLNMHITEKWAPALIPVLDWLSDKIGKGAEGKYDKTVVNGVKTAGTVEALFNPLTLPIVAGRAAAKAGKKLGEKYNGNPTGGAASVTPESFGLIDYPKPIGRNSRGYIGELPNLNYDKPANQTVPTVPNFMTTPEALAPTNTSSIIQTNHIEITNQNNINGTNVQDVKDGIVSINENDIDFSWYQVRNMVGI